MINSSPNTTPRRNGTSAEWIAAILLLIVHVALAWQGRAFGITTGNDDASYLLLSRELRHGDYTDHYLLGAPPHSQYPPGFPAFLALIALVAGERLDVMQAAIILCSAAALGLLYDAVRRSSGSAPLALAVLALSAVNPSLVKLSGMIMSETLYLLLTMLVIWAVILERNQAASERAWRGWAVVAIVCAVAAALTRTIGLTLLAALFLTWLMERRYRRVLVLSAVSALTAGAWIVWTIVAPGQVVGRSYIADATFAGEGQQSLLAVFFERIATNVPFYLTRAIPASLPQPTLSGTALDNVLALAGLLLLLTAGVWALRQTARVALGYLGVAGALLSVWTWTVTRFIVPIIPILHWILLAGAFRLARLRRWLSPLPFVVTSVIGLTAIVHNIRAARTASTCDRERARTAPGCYAIIQRGFFEAAAYARTHTLDGAVFFTMKEATFGYLSGRRVLTPNRITSPRADSLIGELHARGVAYAVVSPLQPVDDQRVDWLIQGCRALRIEREFSGLTLLIRVAQPKEPGGDACQRLQQYISEEAGERREAKLHGAL